MSSPDAENRIKTQLIGLQKMNFEIHTLGLGDTTLAGVERHFKIRESKKGPFSSIWRLLVHLSRNP
jgi:hypothetical protein